MSRTRSILVTLGALALLFPLTGCLENVLTDVFFLVGPLLL